MIHMSADLAYLDQRIPLQPISPILVSPNGRHVVDRHAQPVFWLGDTQWELFRRFDPETALRILKNRQAKGFNVILVMLTGVDFSRIFPDKPASFANLEGENPWIGFDPLRPNEAYFRHVDTLIRLGEQTGQTLVVGVYHKWHADVITLEKARPWARWVAGRYRDVPNLIWSMYPTASSEFIPACRELAAGLQEGDGGRHLICVHPDPGVASSSFIHAEPWLAFNMIQTCVDYDQIFATVTADYQRTPAKPVVMAEGGYEGLEFNRLHTPHDIRKQAYWTQLAGGHFVYGHNDAWAATAQWKTWLDAPGSAQLAVFRQVITSLDSWWDLIPDQSLFTSGMGNGFSLNAAACSPAGRWIIAYLSEPCAVSLNLTGFISGDQARATWIDPASGERLPAGTCSISCPGTFSSPTGWEDALLLVEPVL